MNIFLKKFRLSSILVLLLSLIIPASAVAQVIGIQTPDSVKNVSSLAELIPRLFNIGIGVAGILFVVLLLLGGVQYLVSLGDEDAVTKARKLMLNAGIGLIIVVSSWGVGNYVLKLLGISVSLTGGTIQSSQTSVGGGAVPSSGGGTPTTPGATAPAPSNGQTNGSPTGTTPPASNQPTSNSPSVGIPQNSSGATTPTGAAFPVDQNNGGY
jgi:hypothetical protein